jgi:hypothetical protein
VTLSAHYDTDKLENGLLAEYETRFANLRSEPVTMLELGVDRGGSLRFWSDFFDAPGTTIVGIDLQPPSIAFAQNVHVYRCNQADKQALHRIAESHGPFDLIIDDASHRTKETKVSFSALWPHLTVGGTYVIEDWAVGYWPVRWRSVLRHGRRYRGMVHVITNIVERAPSLRIDALDVVLAQHKAMAFFRKGEQGWQS